MENLIPLNEIMDRLEPYWTEWGVISYHTRDSEKQYHGDDLHHTGACVAALNLINSAIELDEDIQKRIEEINLRFLGGRMKLTQEDGTVLRWPGADQVANRDQLTFWIPAWIMANHHENPVRDKVIDKLLGWGAWMFPQDWVFFKRFKRYAPSYPMRMLGDLFQFGQIYFNVVRSLFIEWFLSGDKKRIKQNSFDSSQIKVYFQILTTKYRWPTWTLILSDVAFMGLFRAEFHYHRYFTFKHDPSDSPPEIHLLYDWVVYLHREHYL